MKKIIFLLLTLFYCSFTATLEANEIRAGAISLEQLSASTVTATITLVIESHADIEDLVFCWGDGDCINPQEVSAVVNVFQGLKKYTFTDTHTYGALGTYTTSISHCCYDGDVTNITSGSVTNFEIETMIVLGASLNTTPVVIGDLIATGTKQSVLVTPGVAVDAEGDSYLTQRCEPDNVNSYSSIDFPNSTVTLNTTGQGTLVWGTPGYDGVYIVGICTEESRNGTLISRSKRIVCYMVNDDFMVGTEEISKSEMLIYPNPVSNGIIHFENKKGRNINCKLLIVNSLGGLDLEEEWNGNENKKLLVGDLAKGVYVVVVMLEGGEQYYKKIVIN